jgi:hypothetical protein
MDPVAFLDAGHQPGQIFTYSHLQFLAEKAITDRLVETPAERERVRSRLLAVEPMPSQALPPGLAVLPPDLGADPEYLAVQRWYKATAADDAFADRVAESLPGDIRAEAEASAERFLRPLTLTPGQGVGGERCRVCGEIIAGPFVHIATRHLDEEDPGVVCALCFIEAAETVGG